MSEIDISDLKKEALDKGNFPVGNKEPFRVHFAPEVHEGTRAHASADTSVEICGVLVGKWETDTNGPYALITNYIRCDNAAQKHAEVTFTQDSWTQINHEMDTKYQDLRIVGWYHSHPDFGIFLSDRDCFIQQHFFSGPGQVAFVIDPVRHLEGLFEWRNGKPTAMHHYWVGEQIHLGETRPAEKQAPKPGMMDDSEAGEPSTGLEFPKASTEGVLNWIVVALACVCAFLLGLQLSNNAFHASLRQLQLELVANYQMYKVQGNDFEERIDSIQQHLATTGNKSTKLVEVSADEEAQKVLRASITELHENLSAAIDALEEVKRLYGHTPEQKRRYNELYQQYHQPPDQEAKEGDGKSSPEQSGKDGSTAVGPAPAAKAGGEKTGQPAPSTPQPKESSNESNSDTPTPTPPAESN
ncbi:MAG: Mov34/MPN/PAD-1 family protein [Planctomycetaceae bacterium]|nr:Mov34/MPN/PAD-1 family protein [Planctomycetaceae bacterium]